MIRTRTIVGIALFGLLLTVAGTSWADPGRGGHRHRDGGVHHAGWKNQRVHEVHHASHKGWGRDWGHRHRPAYRPCPPPRYGHGHRHPPVYRKHVHHHYYGGRHYVRPGYASAFSIADSGFGFSIVVGGHR